jgi:hypothetical protein
LAASGLARRYSSSAVACAGGIPAHVKSSLEWMSTHMLVHPTPPPSASAKADKALCRAPQHQAGCLGPSKASADPARSPSCQARTRRNLHRNLHQTNCKQKQRVGRGSSAVGEPHWRRALSRKGPARPPQSPCATCLGAIRKLNLAGVGDGQVLAACGRRDSFASSFPRRQRWRHVEATCRTSVESMLLPLSCCLGDNARNWVLPCRQG